MTEIERNDGAFEAQEAYLARLAADVDIPTTCGDCIQLDVCAYEFDAKATDPVCTGFREPLRKEKHNDRD